MSDPDWRTEDEIERDERRARRVTLASPAARMRERSQHRVRRPLYLPRVTCECGATVDLPPQGFARMRTAMVEWFELHLKMVRAAKRAVAE